MMINVLIVGSGGREHAFTWKASHSDLVERIFVAPGNAGTSLEPKAENIDISASDIDALVSFSKKENIDLVIVGPEDPLVNGIKDYLLSTDANRNLFWCIVLIIFSFKFIYYCFF